MDLDGEDKVVSVALVEKDDELAALSDESTPLPDEPPAN